MLVQSHPISCARRSEWNQTWSTSATYVLLGLSGSRTTWSWRDRYPNRDSNWRGARRKLGLPKLHTTDANTLPPPTTLGMCPGAADARAHIITKSGRLLVSPNRNLCFRLAPPPHIIFARTLPQVPAGLAPPISIAISLSLRLLAVNAPPLF